MVSFPSSSAIDALEPDVVAAVGNSNGDCALLASAAGELWVQASLVLMSPQVTLEDIPANVVDQGWVRDLDGVTMMCARGFVSKRWADLLHSMFMKAIGAGGQ